MSARSVIVWAVVVSASVATMILALPALAQISTTTTSTAVTIDQLLQEGKGVIEAFQMLGVLGGLTALIHLLVNATKFGPVNQLIINKGLRWVRPLLAVVLGLLGGLSTAMMQTSSFAMVIVYTITGAMAGGGSIALHELISVLRGEVK